MDDWNLNERITQWSDNNFSIVNSTTPIYVEKERQISLGLKLVLVALHGWFTFSIEQAKLKGGDTKHNVLVY
jgi:hypothetical protein